MKVRPYPTYKPSDVEWMGDIPKHWSVVQSRRLFSERNEKAIESDRQLTASQKYGVIYQDEFMSIEGQKVVQVITGADILKHVEPGDFVISMRSFQGGIESSSDRGSISSAYVMLKPEKHVYPKYFSYLFKSKSYIQALQRTSNLVRDGQALRFNNFSQVPLPIVPEEEQVSIASFLDRETDKIDTLISKQEKLIELLREKRQAIISHAVTKGLNANVRMKDSGIEWLGEVPEHWGVMPLKRAVNLINEKSFALENGLDYVGMEDIESWTGNRIESSEPAEAAGTANEFKARDVLFGKLRPYLAKSWLADIEGCCSSEFLVLRPETHSSEFLQKILLSREFISTVDSSTYGSKMPRASWEFIGMLGIPVPPESEQKLIVEYLGVRLTKLDLLSQKAEQAIALQREHRTALISAAVTGKIDVRAYAEDKVAA